MDPTSAAVENVGEEAVVLSGIVRTAAHRDAILRVAAEELGAAAVRSDLVVASASAPDRPEELP
ncbi:hypothetical protein [Streptomyces sp. NPDC001970]